MNDFILNTRRHETPFYAFVYKIYKSLIGFEFPCIRLIHGLFYKERILRTAMWFWIGVKFYYEPVFKSQCVRVGKGFRIIRGRVQGMPQLIGKVYIEIGENVTIQSVITIAGNKVYDKPKLIIGDNTYIGTRISLNIGKEISIGKNCYLADAITIRDNDGHPVDSYKRGKNQSVDKNDIKPVKIGDSVWIGSSVIIQKGVTIGDGAVVGSGSLVTKSVEPFTIVAGNPATIIRKLK